MPMQPCRAFCHIMTAHGVAGVGASALALYERLRMDVWWHTPFSLWKNSLCQSLLWIIHDTARRQPVANYTRVRTWRKCAWLVGQRPHGGTSPANIFDTAPYFGLAALQHFAVSISTQRNSGECRTLEDNVRPARCASWNVTSLVSEDQREQLIPTIKAIVKDRILVTQEAKIDVVGHGLQARIPMCHIFITPPLVTHNGGRSAGLATFVPLHLTGGRPPEEDLVVPHHVHCIAVRYQDLLWRFWNVYAPPGRQASIAAQTQTFLDERGQDWIDRCINVLAGDFNCDPDRPEDSAALEAWRAVAVRLDTGFAYSSGGTFQGPKIFSNIDHFAVPELADRHAHVIWRTRRHGPLLRNRHSPILLDASMRSKRAPHRGHVKHSTLRADLFLRPSLQRDVLVRRLLDVARRRARRRQDRWLGYRQGGAWPSPDRGGGSRRR